MSILDAQDTGQLAQYPDGMFTTEGLCSGEQRLKRGRGTWYMRSYSDGAVSMEFECDGSEQSASQNVAMCKAEYCHLISEHCIPFSPMGKGKIQLARYLDTEYMYALRVADPAVVSVKSMQSNDAVYMLKADGIGCYLFECSSVWMLCIADPMLTLLQCRPGRVQSPTGGIPSAPFCVRVELMETGRLVHIDDFTNVPVSGRTCMPLWRTRRRTRTNMHIRTVPFKLIMRREYPQMPTAEQVRSEGIKEYGVIVLMTDSNITFRIKEKQTVDLQWIDGHFWSSDGERYTRRFRSDVDARRFKATAVDGAIYEATLRQGDRFMRSVESLYFDGIPTRRYDKAKANASIVVAAERRLATMRGDIDGSTSVRVSMHSFNIVEHMLRAVTEHLASDQCLIMDPKGIPP